MYCVNWAFQVVAILFFQKNAIFESSDLCLVRRYDADLRRRHITRRQQRLQNALHLLRLLLVLFARPDSATPTCLQDDV